MSVSFGSSSEKKLGASRIEWRKTDQGLVAYVIKSNGRAEQVVWAPQPGSQEAFLSCPVIECLYEGTRGPGKRLEESTLILTDKGWVQAKDVTMDHRFVAPDGTYTELLGIYPHPPQELYEIEFDEGQVIKCGPEHLWSIADPKYGFSGARGGWKVKDTEWIAKRHARLQQSKTTRGWLQTPRISQPVPGKTWEGPDPYILGLLLGGGTYNDKTGQARQAFLYSADEEIRRYVQEKGWSVRKYEGRQSTWMCWPNGEANKAILEVLPPAKGAFKSVPQVLLEADPETRLAVLQGLVDSDGCVDTEGRVTFTSISKDLMEGVQYLVRSLGGKMNFSLHERDEGPETSYGANPRYRGVLSLPNGVIPCRLTRKAERIKPIRLNQHRGIVRVEKIEEQAPAICFAVAHPSHLFVIEGFVLTHNTDALIMDFCQDVGKGWGVEWRGIIFRKSYPDLQDIIEKSRKWIPRIWPQAKYNETKSFWEWPTGEKLYFRQFSKPSDYYKYHGHAYPFIGWEELTTWPDDKCFKSMFSCLRSTKVGMPRKVRATTNPYGVGHNWVKMRYQLPVPKGQIIGKIITDSKDDAGELELPRVAIHGYLDENKVLLTADPDYKKNIRTAARNPAELAAWLDGSWDIVAGGMFDDIWYMGKDYILVEPFKIPDSWRIDRSFDWGSNAPFSVGWWAESDGSDYIDAFGHRRSTVRGDLFRIAEWYGWTGKPNEGKRLLATEIARGIVEYELEMGWRQPHNRRWCRVRPGPADNAIFDDEQGRKKDDPNAKSKATDMGMPVRIGNLLYPGITWEYSDKSPGSRKQGWEQMRAMMKAAIPPEKRIPPEEGLRERPGLFVFNTCDQFIRTVPALPRDENDMDDVDSEAEDHIGDECRYRVRFKKRNIRSGLTTGHY